MIKYFVFYCKPCFYRNASWKISCDDYDRAFEIATDLHQLGHICDIWSADFDTKKSTKVLSLK